MRDRGEKRAARKGLPCTGDMIPRTKVTTGDAFAPVVARVRCPKCWAVFDQTKTGACPLCAEKEAER